MVLLVIDHEPKPIHERAPSSMARHKNPRATVSNVPPGQVATRSKLQSRSDSSLVRRCQPLHLNINKVAQGKLIDQPQNHSNGSALAPVAHAIGAVELEKSRPQSHSRNALTTSRPDFHKSGFLSGVVVAARNEAVDEYVVRMLEHASTLPGFAQRHRLKSAVAMPDDEPPVSDSLEEVLQGIPVRRPHWSLTAHETICPLPAIRPKNLVLDQEQAADSFDEMHEKRTYKADATLGRLAKTWDELRDGHHFKLELQEVFRSRYRVDEGPPVITRHVAKIKKKKKWSLWDSIWLPRTKHSDAKDFWDTPYVKRMAFERDWAIAVRKHSLEKKLGLATKKLGADDQARAHLQALHDIVFSHFDTIMSIFNYYSTIGPGDDLFSISRQGFSQLITDCDLIRETAVGQRLADLNILFEGVNAKQTKDELFNHRKTLNREEWIALITQVVLTRHVASEEAMGVDLAFETFFDRLRSILPEWVVQDANVFRNEMCYPEAVDFVLKHYEEPLRLVFEVFATGDGAIGQELRSTKLMDIGEYSELVGLLDIVDEYLPARDVSQAFAFCRMLTVGEDTVKGRAKLLQLHFEDFLECLVRLAYSKAMPTDTDLQESGCRHAGQFLAELHLEPVAEKEFHSQRKRAYGEPPPQPIQNLVHHFVDWLIYNVQGGVDTGKVLTRKEVQNFKMGRSKMGTASVGGMVGKLPEAGGAPELEADDVVHVRVGGPDAELQPQ